MLDIVIPSKNERFLRKTIEDVLSKSTSDIHIYPVLDGYDLPQTEVVNDDRVTYIKFAPTKYSKKRQAINYVAQSGFGEYLMSLDAHCMMAPGFDTQLIKDHKPNWVQIPRRHRLDPINWCIQSQYDEKTGKDKPPIDYEYIMFPDKSRGWLGLHGYKWDERTLSRMDIPIDETMEFQGSCWFMTKDWFKKMGFMDLAYQGWGQEAEEIGLTTYKNGGSVMTNKNTWYAHLHKGEKFGRMYFLSKKENLKSYEYSYKHWVYDNKDFFISFINKFNPPKWGKDWEKIIYAG